MKRFLIFPALFPPLALLVFNAPDAVMHHDFKLLDVTTLGASYIIAIVPALMLAAVDAKWRSVQVTTLVGALTSGAVVCFLWDGFRELFPALMAFLLGGFPAAVCSLIAAKT
jgi:hypothetical protein